LLRWTEEGAKLKVGAGKSKISFGDIFPTPEGFTGVHDPPSVKTIIIEGDAGRFAILLYELVGIAGALRQSVNRYLTETAGVPEENIVNITAHVLSTPHGWNIGGDSEKSDIEKDASFCSSIADAAFRAVSQALERMHEARIGYGIGFCGINTSRNIFTKYGCWLGSNDEAPHNHEVPIIRFDSMDGTPMAMIYGYGAQPSIMDGSVTRDGRKLISGDLCASASEFIESQYGDGFVAMYFTGAGGDQAPAIRAKQTVVGRGGSCWERDIHEDGFLLVRLLGERLGQQVVMAADRITTKPLTGCSVDVTTLVFDGQKRMADTQDIKPRTVYSYEPDGQVAADVLLMKMDDITFIGLRPEICAETERSIRDHCPRSKILMATFCAWSESEKPHYSHDGTQIRKEGKYMAPERMYELVTYQSMNSSFAKGSAESLARQVVQIINGQQ
jgi:hypothetical protein